MDIYSRAEQSLRNQCNIVLVGAAVSYAGQTQYSLLTV